MRITIILLLLCGCSIKPTTIAHSKAQPLNLTKNNIIQIVKKPKALDQILKPSKKDLEIKRAKCKDKNKMEEEKTNIITNLITTPKKSLTSRDISPNRYESHKEWTQRIDNRTPKLGKQAPELSIPILDLLKKE